MRQDKNSIIAVSALSVLLLSGCAAPTAVMLASQAFSGVSYLATGKGTTDHVLSAAMEEDCALHRAISGAPVCQPLSRGAVAAPLTPPQTASLGDLPPMSEEFLVGRPTTADPVRVAMAGGLPADAATADADTRAVKVLGFGADMFFVPHSPAGATGPVSGRAGAGQGDAGAPMAAARYYLVLGSFSDRRIAAAIAAGTVSPEGEGGTRARVVPVWFDGGMIYRVVLGPFDLEGTASARRQLAAAGLADAPWALPACDAASARECISAD